MVSPEHVIVSASCKFVNIFNLKYLLRRTCANRSHSQASEWTTLVLAYILVALRLTGRVVFKQTHLFVSDIWLLLASACVLGLVICDTLTYQMGAMSDFDMVSDSLGKVRLAPSSTNGE